MEAGIVRLSEREVAHLCSGSLQGEGEFCVPRVSSVGFTQEPKVRMKPFRVRGPGSWAVWGASTCLTCPDQEFEICKRCMNSCCQWSVSIQHLRISYCHKRQSLSLQSPRRHCMRLCIHKSGTFPDVYNAYRFLSSKDGIPTLTVRPGSNADARRWRCSAERPTAMAWPGICLSYPHQPLTDIVLVLHCGKGHSCRYTASEDRVAVLYSTAAAHVPVLGD